MVVGVRVAPPATLAPTHIQENQFHRTKAAGFTADTIMKPTQPQEVMGLSWE